MKKCILFLFHFLTIALTTKAQNTITLGPEVNVVTNNFEYTKNIGAGLSVEYFAKLFSKGGIKIYAAYDRFPQQFSHSELGMLPVRVGYMHFLYSDNLFVFGDVGLANYITSTKDFTGLSIGAGTGYKVNLPKAKLLQFSLFYNYNRIHSLTANWLTLRASYGLKFGKRKAFKRE